MARGQARQGSSPAHDPIRILHLSDFHFSKDTGAEANPVLKELVDEIERLVGSGLAPDVVAITGDVAFSGKKSEYDRARKWIDTRLLKALPRGLSRKQIFMVPGNHDVDRDIARRDLRCKRFRYDLLRAQEEMSYDAFQKYLNEYLEAKTTRRDLLKPQRQYLEFAADYGSKRASWKDGMPWWRKVEKIKGVYVLFSGICSSLLAEGGRSDRGRQVIGQRQLDEVVHADSGRDCQLRVVLVHHPHVWLSGIEADEVEMSIHAKSHVVLTGHLHQAFARAIVYPHNRCLELRAGCAFESSRYPNAFQLLEFDPKKRHIVLRCWTWNKESRRWIPDRNFLPWNRTGKHRFELAPHATGQQEQRRKTTVRRSTPRRKLN